MCRLARSVAASDAAAAAISAWSLEARTTTSRAPLVAACSLVWVAKFFPPEVPEG